MFYPLGESKYITLQPFSNYSGKKYDYWNEVINYMIPHLQENEIKIVQIGGKEDAPLAHSIWTQGSTSVSQASFLIKNSMLHLGVDSFGVHIASASGKKIVALYSTNWAENCKPYWSEPEDYVLLEPDRSERKPSFQFEDVPPKTINEIKPEDVASAALKLLNLNSKTNCKTLHIGKSYTQHNVHVVPTSRHRVLDNFKHLVVRMDLEFNEDVLYEIALNAESVSIMTNRPIDKQVINKFKGKIKEIIYIIDKNHDVRFVKFLHGFGVHYILLTSIEGDELSSLKFDYLDYDFIFSKESFEKEKAKILTNDLESLVFRTNRKILKDDRAYPSLAALKSDEPLENIASHEFSPVSDDPLFWEDLEYFYIAKKLD
jgi:hypothetical protein